MADSPDHFDSTGPAAPPMASLPGVGAACPVCQERIGENDAVAPCPACRTVYHTECWEYNKGCGVYGCTSMPPTEKRGAAEIPAAYWGQEHKPCPRCGEQILAAALRCRHCGTTFASSRPEDAEGFQTRARLEELRPRLQRFSVALFIGALLPCTAPLAALVGSIWYFRHRRSIATLPPLRRAIAGLALGVAIGQTVLLVVFGLVYGFVGN